MTKQVFISYKHKDHAIAIQLHDTIKSWGYEVWLDKYCIQPGDNWLAAIDKGLKEMDCLLALLTPAACDSRHVKAEWDYAHSEDRPIVPMKYEDCSEKLPFYFKSLQHIDFKEDEAQAFAQLKQALGNVEGAAQVSVKTVLEVSKREIESVSPRGLPTTSPTTLELSVRTPAKPLFDDSIRGQMLQKVYEYWIEGVLEKSLLDNPLIDLGVEGRPQAVLRHVDYGEFQLSHTERIDQIFNDLHRELLILGAPGSGKTFTALQLLRELIHAAQRDREQDIPVMFNLSSWVEQQDRLADWLIHELQMKYQVPKKVAETWVANEQLIILLDGLDEVRKEYRDLCVTKINEFRQAYRSVDMVVCSRILDYEDLTERLDLVGAVLLQPLSKEQIAHAVQSETLTALRQLLQTDSVLAEMAQSPFLLNTMRFAYEGVAKIPTFSTFEERRDHLFDQYVEKRVRASPSDKYLLNPMRHYLAWLARNMVKQAQTVFHIEGLEPDWLEKPELRRKYAFWLSLYRAVAGAIITGLPFAIGGGIAFGLPFGVMIGLVLGLVGFVVSPFSQRMVVGLKKQTSLIEPVEIIKWSWRAMLRTLPKHVAIMIGFGVGLAIGFGVAASLVFGSEIGMSRGLTAGFAFGLAVGIVGWVSDGFVTGQVLTKTIPNEGIFRSARNALYVAPIYGIAGAVGGGLGFGLVSVLVGEISNGVVAGAIGGFVGGVMVGLSDKGAEVVIQHGMLRQILYQAKNTPRNYADFLDYAADRDILRKVGGGYTFLHRLLLEYFAEIKAD